MTQNERLYVDQFVARVSGQFDLPTGDGVLLAYGATGTLIMTVKVDEVSVKEMRTGSTKQVSVLKPIDARLMDRDDPLTDKALAEYGMLAEQQQLDFGDESAPALPAAEHREHLLTDDDLRRDQYLYDEYLPEHDDEDPEPASTELDPGLLDHECRDNR